MTEEEKKKGECCPDCFLKNRISGDDGEVDVCSNLNCRCHHPLGVVAGEETNTQDKFGHP